MAERGREYGEHRRPRLDRRRGRADRRPAMRRSRSRIWAGTSWSLRHAHPLLAGLAPGSHAYFVHSYHFRLRRRRRPRRRDRLRRPAGGGGRARQSRRHAVSSRKEPGGGPAADRQFPAVASMTDLGIAEHHGLGRAADPIFRHRSRRSVRGDRERDRRRRRLRLAQAAAAPGSGELLAGRAAGARAPACRRPARRRHRRLGAAQPRRRATTRRRPSPAP